MSVILKGMEMPKNCSECRMWSICTCLNDFEDYESICYAVDDGDLVRDKNCPLVDIPTPHGRLGDLDKLIDSCKQYMNMLGPESKEYTKIFALKCYLVAVAEEAVIEAEGSET